MGGCNRTFARYMTPKTRSWGALVLCSMLIIGWLRITSTIWLLILSSTSFMVGRSRVFYVYSSWKIYRSVTPLGPPWATGRLHTEDVVHSHSAHGYYITRMGGGIRYSWYWQMSKQNELMGQAKSIYAWNFKSTGSCSSLYVATSHSKSRAHAWASG